MEESDSSAAELRERLPGVWLLGLVSLGFGAGLLSGLSREPVVGALLPLLFGILAGGTGLYVAIGPQERRKATLIGSTLLALVPSCLVGALLGGIMRKGDGACIAYFPGFVWCPGQEDLANHDDAYEILSRIELRRLLAAGGASLSEIRAIDATLVEWPAAADAVALVQSAQDVHAGAITLAELLASSDEAARSLVRTPVGSVRPQDLLYRLAELAELVRAGFSAGLNESGTVNTAILVCSRLRRLSPLALIYSDLPQVDLAQHHRDLMLRVENLCQLLRGTRLDFIEQVRRRLPAAGEVSATAAWYGVSGMDVSRDELVETTDEELPIPDSEEWPALEVDLP